MLYAADGRFWSNITDTQDMIGIEIFLFSSLAGWLLIGPLLAVRHRLELRWAEIKGRRDSLLQTKRGSHEPSDSCSTSAGGPGHVSRREAQPVASQTRKLPDESGDDSVTSTSPVWLAGQLVLGIAALAIVLFAIRAFKNEWFFHQWYELGEAIINPIGAQVLLGTVFGVALRGWTEKVISAQDLREQQLRPGEESLRGTGIEDRGQSRFSLVDFVRDPWVVLPLVLALLAAGMISRVETDVVTVELVSTMQSEQRRLDIELSDPVFQIPQVFLTLGDLGRSIDDTIELIKAAGSLKDTTSYSDSKAFHKEFIEPLVEFVHTLIHEQKHSVESIRERTRQIALELRKLVLNPQNWDSRVAHDRFARTYAANMRNLMEVEDSFVPGLVSHGKCGFKAVAAPARIKKGSGGNCAPEAHMGVEEWPASLAFVQTLANSPYIYITVGYLLWFNDNVEGAKYVIEGALNNQVVDDQYLRVMKTNLDIGKLRVFLMQMSGDPASEKIVVLEGMLKEAERAVKAVSNNKDLRERYRRWLRPIKNNLAYYYVQEGKEFFTAKRYAKDNYEADSRNPLYIGTYGYVMMADAARQRPLDAKAIKKARELFKESREFVQKISDPVTREHSRLLVDSHLSQAEKLLLLAR